MGDKCSKYEGTIVVYDKINKLKAVINMDTGISPGIFDTRPTDIFNGFLYKVIADAKFKIYHK